MSGKKALLPNREVIRQADSREVEWNPRFVDYLRTLPPDEDQPADMVGFIAFIRECSAEFAKAHPAKVAGHRVLDQEAFTRFIGQKVGRIPVEA